MNGLQIVAMMFVHALQGTVHNPKSQEKELEVLLGVRDELDAAITHIDPKATRAPQLSNDERANMLTIDAYREEIHKGKDVVRQLTQDKADCQVKIDALKQEVSDLYGKLAAASQNGGQQ